MRIAGMLLVVVMVWHAGGAAQTDSTRVPGRWDATVMQDVGTFWKAFLFIGSAPSRWNGRDIGLAGGIVVSTGVVALGDDEVSGGFRAFKGRTGDRFESVVRMYGEVWVLAVLCGGSYATGVITGDRWIRETAFLAGTGLILTAGATQVLKYTAGRARPYTLEGPGRFRMLSADDDHHSFPSGHTAAAFSLSTVLAHQIGNDWATAGLYTLAAMTSLSRVYAGEHWFSDCVFSAILSTAITQSLVQWYDTRTAPEREGGLHIVPGPAGVSFVYTF
jgi:membrane-associated phospholipid phosphatase